jgi:capsular exopolysaccharide synthesis family protein
MDNGQQPDNLAQFLQDTEVPRLKVITSGFIPENPTELLGSVLMRRWMDVFRKSPNIDVVLMDTPPCLLMSDSVALAAATTADVILVLQAARTRRVAAQKAKEQFLHVGSEIKGIVLNSVVTREEDYYGYGYYTYYHQVPVEQIKSMGMPQNENRT